VSRPRTDRQLVAAAFRGKLQKPARSLSDAYVARLAREVRAARAEGRTPQRQAGRGHTPRTLPNGQRITTEHPRARVRRGGELVPYSPDIEPTALRRSSTDRHVAGHGVLLQRDFRQGYAAYRWMTSLPADVGVQVIAHGELLPDYPPLASEEDDDAELRRSEQEERDAETAEFDDDGNPIAGEAPPPPVVREWRVVYTGNAAGEEDANGVSIDGYDGFRAAVEAMFVPGSVDTWVIRWQR